MVTSISKVLLYSKSKKKSKIVCSTKRAPLNDHVSSSGIHKMAGLWEWWVSSYFLCLLFMQIKWILI